MLQDRQLAKQLREKKVMANPKAKATESEDTPEVPNVNDETSQDDSMPPEFNDTEAPQGAYDTPTSNGNSGIMGLDLAALKGVSIDTAARNKAHAEMTVPRGDWKKSSRWKLAEDSTRNVYLKLGDTQPGDQSYSMNVRDHGRLIVAIQGELDERVVNGFLYKPTIYLRMSPDRRRDENKPGQYDLTYRLYDQACQAYLSIHGRELKEIPQLVEFLLEDTFIIRTMEGDMGPLPVGIRADVKGRRS